jgi:hypothetical protein
MLPSILLCCRWFEYFYHTRSGRRQNTQPSACLRRQSVFGKPVPHLEIPTGFPDSFGSIEDARGFCQSFFQWYNHQHHHSGLGLMTPAMVHHGPGPHILAHRQVILDAAFRAHPERFVRKPPQPPVLASQVWINRPPSEGKIP